MNADLSRRLGAAFGLKPVSPDERRRVIAAAQRVDTWGQLPAAIRQLVEAIGRRPDLIPPKPKR